MSPRSAQRRAAGITAERHAQGRQGDVYSAGFDLHFLDLHDTAITRMALVGYTPQEIASVTGHSLKTVYDMLKNHYLGGRAQLAEQAIAKLELSARSPSLGPSVDDR